MQQYGDAKADMVYAAAIGKGREDERGETAFGVG
jgi:hypothetical protein